MRIRVLGVAATALCVAAAGCGGSHPLVAGADATVSIPAEHPPSPATWPAYPRFSHHSCWARPFLKGEVPQVDRRAPSYAPAPRAHPIPPAMVARRLLALLGDRRYVRSIMFRPAPPATGSRVHVLYAGGHPPADALTATVVAPAANLNLHGHPSTAQKFAAFVASWEAGLVGGALRDDMCAAGGAPLVSWSGPNGGGFSESGFAFEQRFPNPSPGLFRKRVALVGRRYGFRVVSLRLLRPFDLAPLLVVETSRNRRAFAHDMPAIMNLLDPTTGSGNKMAQTFEGFLLAAEDAGGPFAEMEYLSRGEAEGGEWAANNCLYPYPTIGPLVRNGKQGSCS